MGIFMIIPIVDFFIESNVLETTSNFVNDKFIIENFIYTKQRIFISTQNVFTDFVMKNQKVFNDINQPLFAKSFNEDVTDSLKAYDLFTQVFVGYPDLNAIVFSDMCVVFNKVNISPLNCEAYQNTLAQSGLNPVYDFHTKTLNLVKEQILSEASNINSDLIKHFYSNKDFILCDYIFDNYIQNGYKAIRTLLLDIFTTELNSYFTSGIIFFILYVIIILFYALFVWTKIEKTILNLESDTFKIFAILPPKFVREYSELNKFLKEITNDDGKL